MRAPTAEPRTVLCVDDNRAMCENLKEILEDAGYAVRIAASCAEARERARPAIDVGLIDLRLPDGDGVRLAGELRELAPDAQIIMLTGFATVESAVAAVRSGAWAYLIKPCSTPDLLLTVEHAVQQIRHSEEKRELMRRARLAEKLAAIGTLTAGLSHEIKNPLNAAALLLTVLERRVRQLPDELRPELAEPVGLVKSEIARLNRILEDFLDFARPRELRRRETDLRSIIFQVLELLGHQAEDAGVELVHDLSETPPFEGDAGRLHQAIMNLVLNAIQATPAGGSVRLQLWPHENDVVLIVEDSGAGIPEEMRSRIFEPFFTTKPSGSGLGLPLVHSVVEQHGGDITVDDAAAGGARFVIRLPRR